MVFLCKNYLKIAGFFMLFDFLLQEAVYTKGLRDDTTCIVVDILPPEKLAPPVPPPKKSGKGMFKSIFRKQSCKSSSHSCTGHVEPDVLEEMFEDGSAVLAQRSVCFRRTLVLLIQSLLVPANAVHTCSLRSFYT